MSISDTVLAWMTAPILKELRKVENQMAALDDKITAIQTAVSQLGTDLATVIADLKASGQAPTADQLAALDAIVSSLQGLDTTVKAADPGPAPAQ